MRLMRSITLIAGLLAACPTSSGADLAVVHRVSFLLEEADRGGSYEYWQYQIGAYLGSDLSLVGTARGIYGRIPLEAPWKKLVPCRPIGEKWGPDFEVAVEKGVLYYPLKFWRVTSTDSFLVWDDWMYGLYSVSFTAEQVRSKYVESFDEATGKVYVSYVSLHGEDFLVSIVDRNNDIVVLSVPMDLSGKREVYRCPKSLTRHLDTMNLSSPACYSVYQPVDSTIWITFDGYGYVYVVGMDGKLADSVQITAPDFILPQPPRSRMHSQAVSRAWQATFTPFKSITYAPPGYILFQYRTGWENLETDSIPLHSTVVWAADRRPVDIQVNKRWQVAGVTDDGRVIFGEYLIEDKKCVGLILTEARIEP